MTNNILYSISKLKIAKEVWYFLCKNLLVLIPDIYFFRIVSFIHCKRLGYKWYSFNIRNPQTFNEKLNYLKLYSRNKLAPLVADKVAVRDFVCKLIGEEYLIPLIGVYSNACEIMYNDLPDKFVLKTNHGSGWNLICDDKNELNWDGEVRKLNGWLKKNAYYLSREWQYKHINPKLICEELLDYNIEDYKLFCSKGEPIYIQVDSERMTKHERTIFDVRWDETDIQISYPKIRKKLKRPSKLDEMLSLARKLSESFLFCRVDFYLHKERVYFGEITIHPGGGVEPFLTFNQDVEFGDMININMT